MQTLMRPRPLSFWPLRLSPVPLPLPCHAAILHKFEVKLSAISSFCLVTSFFPHLAILLFHSWQCSLTCSWMSGRYPWLKMGFPRDHWSVSIIVWLWTRNPADVIMNFCHSSQIINDWLIRQLLTSHSSSSPVCISYGRLCNLLHVCHCPWSLHILVL